MSDTAPAPDFQLDRLRTAALTYAARGWPVFPCRVGSKVPWPLHGFEEATTRAEHIGIWWSATDLGDSYNVAIATGAAGLVVIDLDTGEGKPDGRRSLTELGRICGRGFTSTLVVRTPSGGLHLYYAAVPGAEIRNSTGRLGPAIDVRGVGGYVLAPPSVIDGGGPYTVKISASVAPLPGWLAERAQAAPRTERPEADAPSTAASLVPLVVFVANQPAGKRNSGLYWAACRAAEAGLDTAPLVAAAVRAGLTEDEARHTAASAVRSAT